MTILRSKFITFIQMQSIINVAGKSLMKFVFSQEFHNNQSLIEPPTVHFLMNNSSISTSCAFNVATKNEFNYFQNLKLKLHVPLTHNMSSCQAQSPEFCIPSHELS
jgi:hypothetical protein